MADKTLLMRYLEQQSGNWNSVSSIKTAVPQTSDRTLRRWLAELAHLGVVERLGDRKGTRYRLASAEVPNAQLAVRETAPIFTPASAALIKRIEAPLYTRPPVTYSQEWVESYVPNQSFYLSADRRAQLQRQGKRPPIHGLAGTFIQKIFNRLLIDLSYNSSRLEGNTYTVADTERLLLQGIGAEGRLDEERIMILNHQEAIRYLVRNVATLIASEETVRTLHYLLADSLVAPGMAGRIRDESILVSGTTYAPLEGRERLQQLLVMLLEKARLIQDPFEQSFFLLGHIAYLQAFIDVNKRTARLACIIPLIANDYVPQSFVDVNKDDYLKAVICFYELNEAGPLADLYYWSYLRSCAHYDTSAQVFAFDEIAALYRSQRRALVSDIVGSLISLTDAPAYVQAHMPEKVNEQHRVKFQHDVMEELANLDVSRLGGLGITRQQLQAWLKLKSSAGHRDRGP